METGEMRGSERSSAVVIREEQGAFYSLTWTADTD